MASSKDLTPSEKMRAANPKKDAARQARPILYFLLGLLTMVMLGACCFAGVAVWWFRPLTSENPEVALKVTQEIVSIEIPDTFVPRGTIQWNIAFLMRLRGVYYERLVGDGVLTLLEVNTKLANDDNIRRHIRDTLLQESTSGTTLVIDPSRSRKETIQVAGEPVMFDLDVAQDPRTSESFHLFEGVIQGKSGQVLLALRVDSNRWLDEPLELDGPTLESSHENLPHWLITMLHSINRGDVVKDSDSFVPTSSPAGQPEKPESADRQTPLPADSAELPLAPAPGPGPAK